MMKLVCLSCLVEGLEDNKNETLTIWDGRLLCLDHIAFEQRKHIERMRKS